MVPSLTSFSQALSLRGAPGLITSLQYDPVTTPFTPQELPFDVGLCVWLRDHDRAEALHKAECDVPYIFMDEVRRKAEFITSVRVAEVAVGFFAGCLCGAVGYANGGPVEAAATAIGGGLLGAIFGGTVDTMGEGG